jgi:acyl-CoA reductase-like NAD-dependent aldehyde dehydrogenase
VKALPILKTYKLFINGAFPRTESGRSMTFESEGEPVAHMCRASRKDLRDAVEAARAAQPKWAAATAYNRGQVLYRIAEMMEGRRVELVGALRMGTSQQVNKSTSKRARSWPKLAEIRASDEVAASIDRLVWFAGWADKYAQVLGCQNPVAGPYYNFSVPEPTGVVAIVAPDHPPLLGLVSLLGAVVCSGNAAVVLASEANPIPACLLGEICATSDVPAGIVNILTGHREELVGQLAAHREINAIAAAGVSADHAALLHEGAAENLKRVSVYEWSTDDWMNADICASPRVIERFVEIKTIWHPCAV